MKPLRESKRAEWHWANHGTARCHCALALLSLLTALASPGENAQQARASRPEQPSSPRQNKSAIYSTRPGIQPASEPIHLRPGPHLFLDEFLIESSRHLARRVNVPQRDPALPNSIVTGKEDGCFQPYLTVLRDSPGGRFRLWYGVHTRDFNTGQSHVGYLESGDGLRWLRPHRVLDDPGPIQFGVSVLDEGRGYAPASQRFKFAWYHGGGLKIAVSSNGLSWTPLTPAVVLRHSHDINGISWDPLRRRYVATVSFAMSGPTWAGTRRVTAQSVSTNLLAWSEPWLVLTPDDRRDEGETQFYAMDGYLTRGDLIIGLVKVLRDDLKADQPPVPPDAYGLGYTTLAWTRDGEHWTRDQAKFFDRHPQPGAWDHAHAWIDEQVPVGDEVYLYYAGYKSGHKVNRFEERQIGLVKMKRDRYVAREAGAETGTLRTPLLVLHGSRLTLNLDAPVGEVRVQVLDSHDQPVPGFALADAQPVRGDGLALTVRWSRSLAELKEQPVRLEFSLRQARLFAVELSE